VEDWVVHASFVANFLAYANSAINPILYGGLNPAFRRAFRRSLLANIWWQASWSNSSSRRPTGHQHHQPRDTFRQQDQQQQRVNNNNGDPGTAARRSTSMRDGASKRVPGSRSVVFATRPAGSSPSAAVGNVRAVGLLRAFDRSNSSTV
jgi:hypothetical protein